MVSLRPMLSIMNILRPSLGKIIPEIGHEFELLSGMLDELFFYLLEWNI
jgi:hypothetical protein